MNFRLHVVLALCFGLLAVGQAHSDAPQDSQVAVRPTSQITEEQQEMLRFYATHSAMTDPGGHADLYAGLPSSPKEVVRVVQGLMVHGALTRLLYDLQPSKEQLGGQHVYKVEDMLGRIRALDARPITTARPPEKWLVVNCRQFAVMACSMFRHHGIPARARAGYATYTYRRGKYDNHWICEYWMASERRWVQVDAQKDDKQIEFQRIRFDTLDMPPGKFVTAPQAWKLCRSGKLDVTRIGVAGKKGWQSLGWDMVRPDVVTDFMALNKLELLPWDVNPFWDKSHDQYDGEALALLDRIAEMTEQLDVQFPRMRELYGSDPRLRMPEGWMP